MALLWACILWVLASSAVALLPMRHQYAPGVALLLAAPALIVWVGLSFSWWAAALAVFAFVSMYRHVHGGWSDNIGWTKIRFAMIHSLFLECFPRVKVELYHFTPALPAGFHGFLLVI